MKISRDWATPLTIGMFMLMAVTGILMFFHLDSGLNKPAHEWLGWALVAGAGAHIVVNWNGFKRYFSNTGVSRAVLAACAVVLVGSFVPLPEGGEGESSAPALAIRAVTTAPIEQVAPLAGRPVDQIVSDLAAAGIPVQPGQSLASVLGKDRHRTGQALSIVFNKR